MAVAEAPDRLKSLKVWLYTRIDRVSVAPSGPPRVVTKMMVTICT